MFNHGKEEFTVNNNDRIAQIVLMPVLKAEFEEVEDLPKTLRGFGGFGSTGKWKKNLKFRTKSLIELLAN